MKRQLVYTLQLIDWPTIELPAVRVSLGASTVVQLKPHIGEFDFLALFSRKLPYEPEVFAALDHLMPEVDTVVEIGANVGAFTLYFAKRLEGRGAHPRVFAFEPARVAFTRLHTNLALNGVKNAQVFNCAVGSQNGFTTFFEPQGHLTNGSLSQAFASHFSPMVEAATVLMVSGDTALSLVPSKGAMLLKIDVEGAEALILRSLEQFILERRPYLLLEVLAVQEQELNELAYLRERYALYNITDKGLIRRERFVGEDFRDYLLKPLPTSV